MKFIFILLVFFICSAAAQNKGSQIIQNEITRIQKDTDWDNPHERIPAEQKIKELSAKYMEALAREGNNKQLPPDEGNNNIKVDTQQLLKNFFKKNGDKLSKDDQEMLMNENTMKELVSKYGNATEEDVTMLLGEKLEKKIEEIYEDEYSEVVKNPDFFTEQTTLVIDMSDPASAVLINNIDKFTSIKVLIITGGKNGASVNLNKAAAQISRLNLDELYIINFKGFVTSLPDKLFSLSKLKGLGVYNNNINKFPDTIAKLSLLEKLYLDKNPVAMLPSTLSKLKNLKELGIAQTSVTAEQITKLQNQLPNCKILTK